MYTVYALYNVKHDKIYIDQTKNIDNRKILHNEKIFKRSYTARFDGKWDAIYKEEHPNRKNALRREKQLKSFRGRQFIKKFIKL